jgi:ubiquinone biosynthesis protein UbiJ
VTRESERDQTTLATFASGDDEEDETSPTDDPVDELADVVDRLSEQVERIAERLHDQPDAGAPADYGPADEATDHVGREFQ